MREFCVWVEQDEEGVVVGEVLRSAVAQASGLRPGSRGEADYSRTPSVGRWDSLPTPSPSPSGFRTPRQPEG